MKKSRKITLHVEFPKGCEKTSAIKSQLVNKAYLSSWQLTCRDGVLEKELHVDGLEFAKTDLLLQLKFLNDTTYTVLLTGDKNFYKIPTQQSSMEVSATYTLLGIEHILIGFDHLLFVFALLLIVRNIRTLIWTITAFTLAHSITLAGSSLGYISLASAPVEAIIALSIMFLCMEVIHQGRGVNGVASRFPWIVSFTFGLLHGFGFAGALAEIGLPEQSVPLALLFFNVGVESGQLIFVTAVILIGFVLKKLINTQRLDIARITMVYGIGSMASFWFIERVAAF